MALLRAFFLAMYDDNGTLRQERVREYEALRARGAEVREQNMTSGLQAIQIRRHAGAVIEHDHHGERLDVVLKERDVDRFAVVENREIRPLEVGDEAAAAVEHRCQDGHHAGPGAERRELRLLGADGGHDLGAVDAFERQAATARAQRLERMLRAKRGEIVLALERQLGEQVEGDVLRSQDEAIEQDRRKEDD